MKKNNEKTRGAKWAKEKKSEQRKKGRMKCNKSKKKGG
jgi:hypothetical protein